MDLSRLLNCGTRGGAKKPSRWTQLTCPYPGATIQSVAVKALLFGISVSNLVYFVHFCSTLNYSSNLRVEKYATGTTTYPRDILAHRLLTINQTPVINKTLELVNYKKGNIW